MSEAKTTDIDQTSVSRLAELDILFNRPFYIRHGSFSPPNPFSTFSWNYI